MSKVKNWEIPNFLQSRRDKIVSLLLSEIIFIKSHEKSINSEDQRKSCNLALEKLDYILKILKNSDNDLIEQEFDLIVDLIYNILREIVITLEKELNI